MAVQFKEPGTVLFSAADTVAMDPDCCCGEEACECTAYCDDGTTPLTITVKGAGVAALVPPNACDCDATWNDVEFELEQVGPGHCCEWSLSAEACGETYFLYLHILGDGVLEFSVNDEGMNGVVFQFDLWDEEDFPENCKADMIGAVMTQTGFIQEGRCDWTGATFEITATT